MAGTWGKEWGYRDEGQQPLRGPSLHCAPEQQSQRQGAQVRGLLPARGLPPREHVSAPCNRQSRGRAVFSAIGSGPGAWEEATSPPPSRPPRPSSASSSSLPFSSIPLSSPLPCSSAVRWEPAAQHGWGLPVCSTLCLPSLLLLLTPCSQWVSLGQVTAQPGPEHPPVWGSLHASLKAPCKAASPLTSP